MTDKVPKAQRLLMLLQMLRTKRYPVSARELSAHLSVSVRTLYRDIQALRDLGVQVEGEAGIGYILQPGSTLPALMFTSAEIEALILGARWVVEKGDTSLALDAKQAISKISAVLPTARQSQWIDAPLMIGPGKEDSLQVKERVGIIRRAIRTQIKLQIHYRDLQEKTSCRIVWPCLIGFFDHVVVLVAWCELRQAFRHFRLDRIMALHELQQHPPSTRRALLNQWKKQQNIITTDII